MFLVFEDRPSDSPFIERVWRCHSERRGIDLHQGDRLDEAAVRDLIRAAVELGRKPPKPKSRSTR